MRPSSLVLALDIGSSSTRCALFTESGARLGPSSSSRKYAVAYSQDGGAELDASLLLRAVRQCVRETLQWRRSSASAGRAPIIAVSGSAFWHSLLALDRDRRPISPVYMWADSRSVPDAGALRAEISERNIHARTGCMLRAPFWPAKLRWLRRMQPALFRRAAHWVSPADWIFAELLWSNPTSHSMASGTGLYNLRTGTWDADLCALCRIRAEQLPCIADASLVGDTSHAELRELPIFASIGDGAAGNLGSGADRAGCVAINLGTSGAVREILPKRQARGRIPLGLFKYVVDETRVVVGGAVSNGGNLRQWFLRELRLPNRQQEAALSRHAAAEDTLTMLPFWVSERALSWPEDLRGAITGFTPATRAADLLRVATTAIFYRLAEILEAGCAGRAEEVIISGGVLHSPASLAILADCLGRDIRVCHELESSLRGGAILALEKLGHRPAPLRPGGLIRHNPALTEKHHLRRNQQSGLERRLR